MVTRCNHDALRPANLAGSSRRMGVVSPRKWKAPSPLVSEPHESSNNKGASTGIKSGLNDRREVGRMVHRYA